MLTVIVKTAGTPVFSLVSHMTEEAVEHVAEVVCVEAVRGKIGAGASARVVVSGAVRRAVRMAGTTAKGVTGEAAKALEGIAGVALAVSLTCKGIALGITEFIIVLALRLVAQDAVGFGNLLEALLGLLVPGIGIGMVFLGELSVGGFDFLV